ncbi:hypothetical protein Vau01_079480 [Virgisporangium aurantiacum]|uniref:Uncharacterized protein n=1 Tax=Virgisporangium aurantiacum TaxID=175570 RepID=A0A8J4E622_9ACTN|nr:hypothetical protein Vau01_079480 [Virgisporangium aurantiacum]
MEGRSPIRLNTDPEAVVDLAVQVDIHAGAVNGLNSQGRVDTLPVVQTPLRDGSRDG